MLSLAFWRIAFVVYGKPTTYDQHLCAVDDVGTTASTPEVSGDSHWSLIDVPSTMEDFLPLSTSSPSLHSTVDCPPENAGGFHPGDATLQAQEALEAKLALEAKRAQQAEIEAADNVVKLAGVK